MKRYTWLGLVCLWVAAIPSAGKDAETQAAASTVNHDPPSGPAVKSEDTIQKKILPEGFSVAGKTARLVRLPRDPRWFLIFDSEPTPAQEALISNKPDSKAPAETDFNLDPNHPDPLARPIEVLPGRWLATMVNIMGDKNDLSVKFRIWGEITAYQKRNYILPTMINMVSLFGQQGEKNERKPHSATPSLDAVLGSDSTKPSTADTPPPPPHNEETLPAQLREALMAIPRTTPLSLSQDMSYKISDNNPTEKNTASGNSGTPTNSGGPQWKDGQMVIDRLGWLSFAPEQQRWLFVFEADSPNRSEPPVIIHPSRMLEMMEDIVLRTNRQPQFRVSGQFTLCQGGNYLLVRKAMVVYDMGNMRK